VTIKRYILALTKAEIHELRAALSVELDSGDMLRGAELAAARRAIAKVDAAEEIALADFDALDWCAGNIIDSGNADVLRERRIKGDPYRARTVIRRAIQHKGKP
jgi:hypothetical protein